MEYVACILCGADEPRQIWRLRRDRYLRALNIDPPISTTVLCGVCGHVYKNPQLDQDEIHRLYRQVYRSAAVGYRDERPGDDYLAWKRQKACADFDWLQTHLPESAPHGRVLEIGCAEGLLLARLAAAGWQPLGLEPTETYAAYAVSELGLDVRAIAVEEFDGDGERYDLVVALKVVEHAKNPVAFLRRVRSLMIDGGFVYLTVPNVMRPDQDLRHFLAAPHISLFTPSNLVSLLALAGLVPFQIDDRRHYLSALASVSPAESPRDDRPAGDTVEARRRAIRRALRTYQVRSGWTGSVISLRRGTRRLACALLGPRRVMRLLRQIRGQ